MNTLDLITEKYDKDFDMLVKIYNNRAGGVHNAEDVVQDAFERAIRYRGSFSPHVQEFGAWFNTIANNSLKSFKRKEKLLGMAVDLDEDEELGESMLEWEDQMLDMVKWELNKKPDNTRQALYLYFFKQYKPREIEQVIDMSNGYIRLAIFEFKKLLTEKYGEIIK